MDSVLWRITATTLAIASIFIVALSPSTPAVMKCQSPALLQLKGAVGPESFAFDPDGSGPYTGVSDGRVLRWEGIALGWTTFAVTSPQRRRECCEGSQDPNKEDVCGRPLGLKLNERTGDLYIADAYFGLSMAHPGGGLATQLATGAEGVPFYFTNGLDIDQSTGTVYFTDSSTRFRRRQYMSLVLSGDKTGRLIKYDPNNKEVRVLLRGLSFANGVAISNDGSFLLVIETTTCRVLRYWLQGTSIGRTEVFAQLPGFPDNIKRNSKGEFWVGMHSRKETVLEWLLSSSRMREAILKLPLNLEKLHSSYVRSRGGGLAMKLSEEGEILEVLENKNGRSLWAISEVEENNGSLWIGSVVMPFVGVCKL